MDEYNAGMDPEIKKYFRKIINSFSMGLLWLMLITTAGLFFGLGLTPHGLKWYNFLFYFVFIASLIWLVRYLYRLWK